MATRKRGGPIAGLLTVPQPLPDDEDDNDGVSSSSAMGKQTAGENSRMAQTFSEPQDIQLASEIPPAQQPTGSRKDPPGTIRLNEAAGRRLWETYVDAKRFDPFLSYRQFASQVVEDGLAVRERARRRNGQ